MGNGITHPIFNKDDLMTVGPDFVSRNLVIEKRCREVKPSKVDELVNSIRLNGVLMPVLVRRNVDGSPFYRLIAGMHRVEAMKILWAEGSDLKLPIRNLAINEDDLEIVEMIENLHRSELTKAERDRFGALVLERMNGSGGMCQKSECVTEENVSLTHFKPPPQKDVITMLNTPRKTFARDFKAYQQDAGVTNNWSKLTEDEYNGFIRWFRNRANELEEKKAQAQTEVEERKKEQEVKVRESDISNLTKAILSFHEKHGDHALVEVINRANLGYLIH